MVTLAKWLGGLTAYVAACVASFLVIASLTARANALIATGALMLLVPLIAATILTKPLRRVDQKASFFGNVVGLSGIWALLVIGLLVVFVRGRLAAALLRVPAQYPTAAVVLHVTATRLGHTLTPDDRAPAPASSNVSPSSSAPTSTTRDPPSAVAPPDAGVVVSVDAAAPLPATPTQIDPTLFAAIEPCEKDGEIIDYLIEAQPADLNRDGIDEILVRCRLSAESWALTDDGRLVQTFHFAPEPPQGLVRSVGSPSSADIDGDGNADLLFCVTWESQKQGTRGGQTWSAQGRGDGTFGELAVIDRVACNGVTLHDITGDRVPELIIVQRGNPWQEDRPHGAVAWLTRSGRSWRQQGRVQVDIYPQALTFADANGDGIDDVIVSHGWSGEPLPRLLLGGKKGLSAAPAADKIPPLADRARADARFDQDGALDRVVVQDYKVKLLRTEPWRRAVIDRVDLR